MKKMIAALLLFVGCGASAPVDSPPIERPTPEPKFKPDAGAFFKNAVVPAAESKPTRFEDLELEYSGNTKLSIGIESGTPIRFGENPSIKSCGLSAVSVVGVYPDHYQLYVYSGVAWYPTVKRQDVVQDRVLAATVLYEESGNAFGLLSAGSKVKVLEEISEHWVKICATQDCSIKGVIEAGRLGPVVKLESTNESWTDGLDAVRVSNQTFNLLNDRGTVVVSNATAMRLWVIKKDAERVEVAFSLSKAQQHDNDIDLYGFVPRSEFDALEIPDDMSMSGWGQGGGGSKLEGTLKYQKPNTWIYAKRDETTKFGRAIRGTRVVVNSEGPDWSSISIRTSWGLVDGFVKSKSLQDEAVEQSNSFAIQGRLIPNDCKL